MCVCVCVPLGVPGHIPGDVIDGVLRRKELVEVEDGWVELLAQDLLMLTLLTFLNTQSESKRTNKQTNKQTDTAAQGHTDTHTTVDLWIFNHSWLDLQSF